MAGGPVFASPCWRQQLLRNSLRSGKMNLAAGLHGGRGNDRCDADFYMTIFRPANKGRSAASGGHSTLQGLPLEATRLQLLMVRTLPWSLHGVFCILTGYLISQIDSFLPRVLGALIAFGGLSWLTYLSPSLVKLSVSLQSGLRPHRGSVGVPVALSDGCERCDDGTNRPRQRGQTCPDEGPHSNGLNRYVEDAKGALRNESQPFYRHRVTGTPKVILQLAHSGQITHSGWRSFQRR